MPVQNPNPLKQEREKLITANGELVERMRKEKRSLNTEEQATFDANYARAFDLAKQISTIDRQNAIDGIEQRGHNPNPGVLPHEDPNAAKGRKYSFLRAVGCLANKRAVDGLEGEVSQEIAHQSQKSPQGFFMPRRTAPSLALEKRAMDTTAGAGSIPTYLSKDWIEYLRNATKVIQAGATQIEDLVGKFAIPRQNSTSTGYWVGESSSPTGSNATMDQVAFTPHTVGAFNDLSRRFFELTNIDNLEEFAKMDQAQMIGRAVDLAAINGSGSSFTPLGLCQNAAITTGRIVSLGTNGGVPTWPAIVEMNTIVSRGNAADLGTLGYMGNADVKGTLATTVKATGYPVYLLQDGKVNDQPFYATQQLPNTLTKGSGTALSAVIYGAWNQVVMAYWSGLDVLVDPYAGGSAGTVRVITLQDMDIQVRHNEAFSFIFDLISNQTQ